MEKNYWRISYKNIGIYEALKKEIWNKCKLPEKEWNKLKNSDAFTWLKTPNVYSNNYFSYFTEYGYNLFMEKTYPMIIKYLDKSNIDINKYILDDLKINIVYKDEHQIVVENNEKEVINIFEYKEMAKYYDMFYSNKSYQKEVDFLAQLIGNRKSILDVGCGTGIHMSILEKYDYNCDGLDLNKEMLDIASSKVKGNLFQGNLLDLNLNKKYDAIISMFAVFNHLDNYQELETGIKNLYNHLNENGIIIIDLHNGRSSGEKENNFNNYKRVMKWNFDINSFKETTEIIYGIDGIEYKDRHVFKIYEIAKLKEELNKLNLKYKLYENYTFNEATDESKNIHIIIYK